MTASTSISGPSTLELEFPPLPSTWDIVTHNESDLTPTLRSTTLTLDSDSDSDSEAWENLDYEPTPSRYLDVALSGSEYAEFERVTEILTSSIGLASLSKKKSDSTSSSAPPTLSVSKKTKKAKVGSNSAWAENYPDEYQTYKQPRARAIHNTHHAHVRSTNLNLLLADPSTQLSITRDLVPVWERLKDPSKSEKRMQFEIMKVKRNLLKSERTARRRDKKSKGGSRGNDDTW